MRLIGRRAILLQELEPHKPFLVGLQETRLQGSVVSPDDRYYMLQSSATEAGIGGCALWVSKNVPYAKVDGRSFFIQEQHLAVTGYSERHICVSIVAPFLKLFVVVGHCPSLCNHPYSVVQQFWADRHSDLIRRPAGTDCVLLLDANSQVGSVETEHVCGHQAECENAAGTLFHEFLAGVSAFLPATCAQRHTGPGHTWRSAQGATHRIDFIALPTEWHDFQIASCTLPDFEALQLHEDHTPVLVRACFCRHLADASYVDCRRRSIRPQPSCTAEQQQQRIQILRALPSSPWHADVDQQFTSFVAAWSAAGRLLTDSQTRVGHKTFISDPTLDLVGWCKAFRRYLHQERQERDRRWCLLAFAAFRLSWEHEVFRPAAVDRANTWFHDMDVSEATAVALLRWFVKALRRGLEGDRLAYLNGLIQQVSLHDLKNPAALYRAVRKAFPTARSARRSGLRPLPAVIGQDGQLASTPSDKAECWRSHFAGQEAGFAVTEAEYLEAFSRVPVSPASFEIASVPTLCQ